MAFHLLANQHHVTQLLLHVDVGHIRFVLLIWSYCLTNVYVMLCFVQIDHCKLEPVCFSDVMESTYIPLTDSFLLTIWSDIENSG